MLVAYAGLYDRDPDVVTFTARDGRVIGSVEGAHQGFRYWTPFAGIPQGIVDKTVRSEDRWFFWHRGLNPFSIIKAAALDLKSGSVVRGGSTITQQLAKNLMQEKEGGALARTLANKAREALLAAGLEMRHGKRWILERYLNTVYYGHRAYGIAAAADVYFSKRLGELSDDDIDALVRLPKAPARYGENLFINPLLCKEGQGEEDHAGSTPPNLPLQRGGAAPVGRHFIEYAAGIYRMAGTRGARSAQLATTLDLGLQRRVEDALRAVLADRIIDDPKLTAAVVAIDVSSGDLLAMAGSRDYFDEAIDGQVNGAVALRQPGSALKPFTYFAAFAKGYSPDSIVPDEPLSFQAAGVDDEESYAPQNFDRRYHGEITMREALANSYNVPAVVTLNDIGLSFYHDLLRKFGITTLNQPPPHYGLSVTLGSGEVTLLQLTNAYAALARGGEFLPWRIFSDVRAARPVPVVPRAAEYAALVTSVLSDPMARRKAFGFNEDMQVEGYPVAVKTGTSFDHRDNWTIGYTPSYAVGVWVGHADGSPLDPFKFTGATGAAPIWHSVMELVLRDSQPQEFARPMEARDRSAPTIGARRGAELEQALAAPKSFRLMNPVDNATFRIHPYLPIDHQMIRAEAEARSSEGARLDWYLDGELLATTTERKSAIWIEPVAGRHRLSVEAEDGERQEIVFRVNEH